MRSDRHYGRFFSARLRQSHIKGDHQCGQTTIPDYGHIFVAKGHFHSRHCGQMSISIYRYGHFERGILYLEAVSYVFHTCTKMRTLQTWQIPLLSFDDNIKSHIVRSIWKIKFNVLH